MNMRNIERNPATYAALISFFETYLATLGEPVVRLSNQVREGDQIDKADLAYKLITIADESFTMLKKLESLRGEHSKADRVTVSLSSEDASKFEVATCEVPYLLSAAEDVFSLLQSGYSLGFLKDEARLVSLFELCARGFGAAADKEGASVERLGSEIRTALSEVLQRAAKAGKG